MNTTLGLALIIGVVAGLRSLTPLAIVAWAAHLGRLNLAESGLGFIGSTIAVIIVSILAIAELIGDKLPMTPKRTALPPLLARIVSGGFCGACICAAAAQSIPAGCALGAIGAVIGAFAGYEIRRRIVSGLGVKDFVVAVIEDLVAIGAACFVVFR